MRTPLKNVLRDHYEVAVIGGGINGAGIAEALAAAGYNVLLVERHDFGSGTTSRSTRLVHGGLRYLEHGEFGLVYESLRERAALLKLFPHLVKSIDLLLPLYEGGPYPRWKARAGLALYDLLALGRGLARHRSLSSQRSLAREPALEAAGLQGALLFSDGQVDMAERLAVECALSAGRRGADVVNHAEVVKLAQVNNGVLRLSIQDAITEDALEVGADVVINATGPWADSLLRRAGVEREPLIGGTRGSHIVVSAERLEVSNAIYAPAKSDGRPFFVLPWLDMFLIGTTDVRQTGDPDEARATAAETDYLLSEVNALLKSDISEADIVYTYSGVRPLPYEPQEIEGAITRRHFLVDHGADGLPGVYSLVGGKLTTYRSVGQKAVRLIQRRIGERWPANVESPTNGDGATPNSFRRQWGARAAEVHGRYCDRPELLERLCEHAPEPRATVVEAVREELATSLADVLLRRTSIGWRICGGDHVADEAASLMGRELGWNASRCHREVEGFRHEVERVRPGVPVRYSAAATSP